MDNSNSPEPDSRNETKSPPGSHRHPHELLSPIRPEFSAVTSTTSLSKKSDVPKVLVRFRAVGNAPIMKRNHYHIKTSFKFRAVSNFLRKELGFKPSESLFLYINSTFAPSPDESVANLFKCFQVDNQLIINYCSNPAWG